MRRTKEDAAITRQHLLKKALAVFSTKGYAAASLQEIAREAELTRGAIYWHFNSKAELYNKLIHEYSQRGNVLFQQAVAEGGTLLVILRRVFIRQLQVIEDDSELRALMELALFNTSLLPELKESRKHQIEAGVKLIEMLTGIMLQGKELGLLRFDIEAGEMARSYLAFQNGLIQLWLSSPNQFSLKSSAEAYADIFIAGIQA